MNAPQVSPPAAQFNHVKHGDVMPHAKKSCLSCFGIGELKQLKPVPLVKLCGCALKRFMKKHGHEVELVRDGKEKGALIWK